MFSVLIDKDGRVLPARTFSGEIDVRFERDRRMRKVDGEWVDQGERSSSAGVPVWVANIQCYNKQEKIQDIQLVYIGQERPNFADGMDLFGGK